MPALRSSREAAARQYAELLQREFEVVYPGLVTGDEDGRRINGILRTSALSALVFAPSMAAPPTYGLHAVEGVDVPIVLWNAPSVRELDDDLTQAAATANTTQVGCVMFGNVLIRSGRPFTTVTACPDDPASVSRLMRTIRGAAAASVVRGAIALRFGDPIAGYVDVEATADELARLAVTERSISVYELGEAFRAVEGTAVRDLLADLAAREWRLMPGAQELQSARLALALSSTFDRHGAAMGTVNCHSPLFRWNSEIGIPACLGVSLLAERNISVSCTGDLPTGLALALGRALSGRALYSEFYTPELSSGLMLLAAGGEGDPAWAIPGEPVAVEPNHHYPGDKGEGAGVSFRLSPGPATVLSLSPAAGGWRLAWATGEVVETRYTRMGGPNGMFRFDSGSSYEAGATWIESGATHHHALAAGRLEIEIPALAQALGVQAIRV